MAVVLSTVWFTTAAAGPALASPSGPNPPGPGSLAFPELSPQSFATPPSDTRVKFRWWQPVADTNDAEIQREVAAMAGNFGGGFEQNGFAAARGGGQTAQWTTLANSQEFGSTFDWGTPLWSHRTEVYQTSAAKNGVIGDMNEGSRWNNTVPTVFSPNQPDVAQDLSYGVQQFRPGQDPSGELPPLTAPVPGGESTTLSVSASPGQRNLQVQSIADLLAGDQITLGRGEASETATIKSVGTASPAVPLTQASGHGQTVVHVPPASTATGVPGTADTPAQFVPGEDVRIGNEPATIKSVGTYDMASAPTTLVLPPGSSGTVAAASGATNVEVASNANFLSGDSITIGTGASAETRKITAVGAAGSGTTLASATAKGDLQISVAGGSGLQAGQYLTIGSGADRQIDRVATISGTTLTLHSRLTGDHAAGEPIAVQGIGVTFTPALKASHDVGDNAIDTGTGVILTRPLAHDHSAGEPFLAPGTGVTLTAPLAKVHLAGANTAIATTAASSSVAGATTVKVAAVTNLAIGDHLTVGQPGYAETVTIQSVGTAGANGTGVTVIPALARVHFATDPVIDSTNTTVTNASGGLSDIVRESLVSAQLVQCLAPKVADAQVPATATLSAAAASGSTSATVSTATGIAAGDQVTIGTGDAGETRTVNALSGTTLTLDAALTGDHASGDGAWDTCTTAATGGTREIDPDTTVDVTKQVTANPLNFTTGALAYQGKLPQGNGQPWELIGFYQHGDTQNLVGSNATTPNQWLGHLSVGAAKAMADYYDKHILNDPGTRAAIAYQDEHTGTPAVFEDSLENSNNLNWVPDMITSWKSDLGYNPTTLLPALAGTGRNATTTPAFDFPQSAGEGATLGWRTRNDYAQMWNDLYLNRYVKTLTDWAASRGMVARFQSYGDPIDSAEAAANESIPETEHLETVNNDETQQFKVVASGTYQTQTPHFLSDECCEANGQAWADTFGIDGSGTGDSPAATMNNAQSVYADQAGGDSQVIYHGWPYTIGAAGSPALWPGNTYGGDTSFAAANGPNQPQFADDRENNVAVARHSLVLRQGTPGFDVAVFHEDYGLTGQGQDNLTNGWNMGTVTSNGVTTRPTSGKLLRSSSSLAQAGYLYGYVSPAFFRYPTAKYDGKTLFPGHGDYQSLVLYDQSVMPVDVADKVASLAAQGLPIVIVGQVPDAAPNATGGTLAGIREADAKVKAAMAKVVAAPHTRVVSDATATGSLSADANAPQALTALGITASTQLNTPTLVNSTGTATPVLGVRRHDNNIDYYQLFNQSKTNTVTTSVTLTGHGTPYLLDTWSGKITPIAHYTTQGDRLTMSLRLGPGNAQIVAVAPGNAFTSQPKSSTHATEITGGGSVVYDAAGNLVARATASGAYTSKLSNGKTVTGAITVPTIAAGPTVSTIGGVTTLTGWQLSVDSWTQTQSGDPTKTQHTAIPAHGSIPVSGAANGSLPSWTAITPQNITGLDPADNLTNAAGIGTYTTSFTLPSTWSASSGAYLNVGAAVDTVDIWVNGKAVTGLDQNDRNQVDVGPYLKAGHNDLKITVATPLRNAVAVAPATPATGQVANSSETLGSLQGGTKIANVGLIGPVTLTPYGQSAALR